MRNKKGDDWQEYATQAQRDASAKAREVQNATRALIRVSMADDISMMKGHTITRISNLEVGYGAITFHTVSGMRFHLYHSRDCCERVQIEDIIGDPKDIIGSPLLMAEEVSSDDPSGLPEVDDDSFTWTFYKFATVRGYLTIRWLGTSNGYYSERVDFDYSFADEEEKEL